MERGRRSKDDPSAEKAADHGELLHAAGGAATGDVDDQVDGLGDEAALGGGAALHGELIEAGEGGGGGVGVDGGDAAGVSGVPGLQEVESLGAADLADDDAVGSEPEGEADERGERERRRGAEEDGVGRVELELRHLFEDDEAVGAGEGGDLAEEGVGEGGLAGAGAAGDEDVLALAESCLEIAPVERAEEPLIL